jgi:SAM-dependent methyltransferase
MSIVPREIQDHRYEVARRWLRGDGVEVGALHAPLRVPAEARVRYVDRLPVAELRRVYPELADQPLVEVDVIDDGERLATIPDGSLDFVVANHMLEHCENPLGTLRCHLAKLKPGGILYYAVPKRSAGFDKDRDVTTFEHLLADDRDAGEGSRWSHYLEWAHFVNGMRDPAVAEANAAENQRNRYSIHFHVWDEPAFRALLEQARPHVGSDYTIEAFTTNIMEIIAVLRKT